MKGVDTNVLVRYIVQDDSEQSKLANYFIEKECSASTPVFINGIILCELVWVLETAYGYNREEIAPVIEKILKTKQFHIHEPHIAWQALKGYKNIAVGFADHYIGNFNIHYGCDHTVTFDKKAGRLSEFKHFDHKKNH